MLPSGHKAREWFRSEKMREGYSQELMEGQAAVEQSRTQLEQWYARKLEEDEIVLGIAT